MKQTLAWIVALAAALVVVPARAQDRTDPPAPAHERKHGTDVPCDGSCSGADPASHQKTLVFEGTPAEWKARPTEAKPYVCDYDLPAAEGDSESPRVNVLFYPMGFEDYRNKLVQHWTTDEGKPLEAEKLSVDTFAVNDLKVRVFELAGTHAAKGAEPKKGQKLVTAHVRAPGGQWNVWLIGPAKGVDKHKATYLRWVRTMKLVDAPETAGQTDAVRAVRFVHGAPAHGIPGPWALTGYRIGKHAFAKLGLSRERAWETVVTYRSPREVRFTCVMDGLLAATGASPGKLNLVFEATDDEEKIEVVVLHKPSGRSVSYKLPKAFRDRIRSVEPAGFPEAARMLDGLADGEVFTDVIVGK